MRTWWIIALCMGCPSPSDEGKGDETGDDGDDDDNGDDDDDTVAEIDATGDWSGACTYITTGYTSITSLGMSLSLVDDAGDVTGTMSYTTYYTGTTTPYSSQLDAEGTRTGDQLTLELLPPDTLTTTYTGDALVFSLVIDGDSMTGTLDEYGTPKLDCQFSH